MEVILTSIFSAIIIFMTVFALIKVYIIARNRDEISSRKFIFLVTVTVIIGLIFASILYFAYQQLFELIFT